MSLRLKGQETELLITVNGQPQRALTNIRSFEITLQLKMLDEGYLGQTTNQKDEIFNGVEGSFEMHLETGAIFDLIGQIVDRARRRTAGVTVNLKSTLQFPSGDRRRVMIADASFGDANLRTPSRGEYVTQKLNFTASGYTVV